MHRTESNETALASEIPDIINDGNFIIAPGQEKKPVSILNNKLCTEQALPYLLAKDKFDYKAPQNIPVNPAWDLNQRLLNFNQYFASDADDILFARSV